jgi:hypothetical protein
MSIFAYLVKGLVVLHKKKVWQKVQKGSPVDIKLSQIDIANALFL